jgi:hypothetical protein
VLAQVSTECLMVDQGRYAQCLAQAGHVQKQRTAATVPLVIGWMTTGSLRAPPRCGIQTPQVFGSTFCAHGALL